MVTMKSSNNVVMMKIIGFCLIQICWKPRNVSRGNVWLNLRHLSTRKEWLKSSISNALLRLPLMTGWICKSASWQIYFKIELLKQCQTCNSDPKQNCIFKFEIQNTSKKCYDRILLAFQFWLHQKFSWVKIIS